MKAKFSVKNISPIYYPIFYDKRRYLNLRGGAGSGKSVAVAQKLLCDILNPYSNKESILACRKIGSTIALSIYKLLVGLVRKYRLDVTINKTVMSISANNGSGNAIFTSGVDDPEKIKSIADITKIWLEETTEFTEDDYDQMDIRLRGACDSFFQLICTYNPIHERHWLKRRQWDGIDNKGNYNPDSMLNIFSTYKDNMFIDSQYKQTLEGKILTNPAYYRIYTLGEWGVDNNQNMWLYNFTEKKHVKETITTLPTFHIHLSFDFNKEPISCVAYQKSTNIGYENSFIHVLKEFTEKFNLKSLCQRILREYPGYLFFVTGDSSGNKTGERNLGTDHETAYMLIRRYLGLTEANMHTNNFNFTHENSRMIMNAMHDTYPNIYYSAAGCPNLINENIIAVSDDKYTDPNKIKKDRGTYKMDLFDANRYFFQHYFAVFATDNLLKLPEHVL